MTSYSHTYWILRKLSRQWKKRTCTTSSLCQSHDRYARIINAAMSYVWQGRHWQENGSIWFGKEIDAASKSQLHTVCLRNDASMARDGHLATWRFDWRGRMVSFLRAQAPHFPKQSAKMQITFRVLQIVYRDDGEWAAAVRSLSGASSTVIIQLNFEKYRKFVFKNLDLTWKINISEQSIRKKQRFVSRCCTTEQLCQE